jgi:hypothetical protein
MLGSGLPLAPGFVFMTERPRRNNLYALLQAPKRTGYFNADPYTHESEILIWI